jgi:hypothetical protein
MPYFESGTENHSGADKLRRAAETIRSAWKHCSHFCRHVSQAREVDVGFMPQAHIYQLDRQAAGPPAESTKV